MAPIVRYDAQKETALRDPGSWICVDLKVAGTVEKFVILKHNGDVYKLGDDGTVPDDPLIKGDTVETQ